VVPYSVVRGVDKDGGTMILTKTISNAKSHLIGKSVPFDPPVLMGAGRGRPGGHPAIRQDARLVKDSLDDSTVVIAADWM
jgi:hypothetical protein